jgi:hypothetical protein
MAKKRAKKGLKDLEPKKARSKKVKGGRSDIGGHATRVVGRTGLAAEQIVDAAGTAVNAAGKAFNRRMNPPGS